MVGVQQCVFCDTRHIRTRIRGQAVIVSCGGCRAVFLIEFDPLDAPGVRGRIERIEEPVDEDTVH